MNKKLLQLIALKLRNKYPDSIVEQCNHVPQMLTRQEKQYISRNLKTSAYYKELKKRQQEEREKTFYETFTIHNPFRSKNKRVANRKEREIFRKVIYNHIPKNRILKLLQHFVIPCSNLSSYELKLLTDPLFISCIDVRLRKYVKVKATELGSNKFAYYLIKENWKRESPNHLVWKFELKRIFGFCIEQKIDEHYRVDLLKRCRGKKIIGEIVCSRQGITQTFQEKIRSLVKELERNDILFLLAPTRLHSSLQSLLWKNIEVVNAKTVMPFLERLLAQK